MSLGLIASVDSYSNPFLLAFLSLALVLALALFISTSIALSHLFVGSGISPERLEQAIALAPIPFLVYDHWCSSDRLLWTYQSQPRARPMWALHAHVQTWHQDRYKHECNEFTLRHEELSQWSSKLMNQRIYKCTYWRNGRHTVRDRQSDCTSVSCSTHSFPFLVVLFIIFILSLLFIRLFLLLSLPSWPLVSSQCIRSSSSRS